MPQAIAGLLLPLITSSPIYFLGPAAVSAVSLGLGYAATAAALYGIQAAFKPQVDTPKPEDGKFNLRQPVPYLPFVLGRVKKGGDYVFLEERDGTAYHIIVSAGHHIKGYVEHWLHDEKLTLTANGYVDKPDHFKGDGTPLPGNTDYHVRILTRIGNDAEIPYAEVVSKFPEIWTGNHRGDGLASVLMMPDTVAQEDYLAVYPNQEPVHTAVIDGHDRIFDPRTGNLGYTTNLALFRLWHLTHPVGGKLSLSDIYLPEWIEAANVCDEIVINRSGAQERRYHGGFWFRANNDPVDVGRLMDQAAELVVYERPDGKVGVHPGKFVAPDVRLDARDIVALSFDANRRRGSNVLAVRGRYTSPENGYVTTDAAPYGDPYADDSERTRTLENQAVQSHNHMARLEKITFIRANAPRVTVVAHYHAAKNVRFRRFVRVHYPPRLEEAIVELTGRPKLSLRNLTVQFEGIVVPPTLYDFNAAVDEGEPGSTVVPLPPSGVPVPQNFDVVIQNEVVAGGATAAFARASWDFVSAALTYEFEWEPTTGGTKQAAMSKAGDSTVRSSYLADGSQYRFRLRAWSGGKASEWTEYLIRTATADPVAPAPVTGQTATGGAGQIVFSWIAPNSANYFASRIYLNIANDFATATLMATEYGAPNSPDGHTLTGVAAGAYFGWVQAINASGVPAAAAATGSITVT
ncbi:hypothetical protein [Mesorhizobium sp. RMAD-H1]|uniref:hypothetical protein n=1 Tax=Mesorhizobium sp. RMAD-H1 TaxID=2587065 RepID=UPI001610D02A|nr:hypothetical protein [Mesorhizobium sp. RMAD-H1]MBB2973940.1 hypothetical protein [Mesorhizobium sp. RMAD-H1]